MSPWICHALAGMGWWKWVGIAAILLTLALTPFTASGQDCVAAFVPVACRGHLTKAEVEMVRIGPR